MFRNKALLIVGRGIMKCVNCGCNRIEMLQINHKNGGGAKERRETINSGHYIFYKIATGKRGIDDLDLRCYVCNALHYAELRWGKLPISISWEDE